LVFGIGFSIGQPAWNCLAGMLETRDNLLFRDKEKAATRGPRWMTRHYLELRKIGAGVPQSPGKNGLKLTSLLGSEVTSLP